MERLQAELDDVAEVTKGAWKQRRPACLRESYQMMYDFSDEVTSLLEDVEDDDDDNALALRAYTSDAYVALQFNPKSTSQMTVGCDYPLYQQMNTALRDYRAGGQLIGSLCSGALWKLKELHSDFGTPADCVYFGSTVDFTDEDGEQLFFKNFRSTSMDYDVAQIFAGSYGSVYEVTLDNSTLCADVTEFSEYEIEDEVLIAPGQSVWVNKC